MNIDDAGALVLSETDLDHLFWELCAIEGLTDGVGGMEHLNRHAWTERATDEWINQHDYWVDANAEMLEFAHAAISRESRPLQGH